MRFETKPGTKTADIGDEIVTAVIFRSIAINSHLLRSPCEGSISRQGKTNEIQGGNTMTSSLSRRRVLQAAALATAAASLTKPFMRGAFAAGKLSVGFWDHWVPGANNTLTKLCNEWAEKNKVEITIDYITTQGDKLLLTGAAEAQARSGHDLLTFLAWAGAAQADALAPLDDMMAQLIQQNGEVPEGIVAVTKQKGHWIAVPAIVGSPTLPACARIDLFNQHAGLDLTKMYPAGAPPDKELTDNWTWDNFLIAAEKCHKAEHAFGIPLRVTNDAVSTAYATLRAHGAQMTDKDGNITVKSDEMRQVLEWWKKLVAVLPSGVFAWDDASNNKALISGQAALIFNPPSPRGLKGRFDPTVPLFWGVWNFSKNISAAKSLLTFLGQRSSVEQTVAVSKGYDIPPFAGL